VPGGVGVLLLRLVSTVPLRPLGKIRDPRGRRPLGISREPFEVNSFLAVCLLGVAFVTMRRELPW
jgi:hypothetical protein